MFTPRGYTAVPQDASQDEDETDNLSKSFEQRKTESASRNTNTMATPRTSRDSEDGEKERRTKRNVRFESRSLEEKPEPMSSARRLCFVVSLMICTLTIFVFAFTVPCKGPSCNVANMITTVTSNLERFHRNWSMAFPGYSTGIVFHLSSTKTREVVVSYGGKRVKEKQKRQIGKSGLISLREDNGDIVWLYNASDVIKLIECRTDDNNFETCLIESSHGKLQLINPKRNQIVWSTRILIGSILPSIIIGINDCDGDDGRDILLSYDHFNTTCMPPSANRTTCTHPGIVQLISGRTGYPLGNKLNIPQSHLIKRVSVHSSRQAENLIFVMTVGNKGHVKVISIQELYRKILDARRGDDSIYLFKNSTVSVSEIVSTDHEPVVKDLNKDFVEDIILVTLAGSKHSLTAVDGDKLKKMWRIAFGSRKMLSQPVIGHFNDDEIPDILVILDDPVLSLLNQSLVQILDGQNGNILWSRKLRLAKNTTPLAANIGYKNDVFLLWIEKESNRKYKKIFPSKAAIQKSDKKSRDASPKATLSDAHRAGRKNVSENTIAHKVEHHRSPRAVQSREKATSSASDMRAELDSLVDEIYAKHVGNTPITQPRENPHLKPRRIENTHKLLEDILKEEDQSSRMVRKESLTDGKQKTTTRLATQHPVLHNTHAHGKPSTNREKVRQMMIYSRGSGTNVREPNPTLTRQRLKVRNNRYDTTKEPTIKISDRGRVAHVLTNKLGNGVNNARHGIPTISATERRTFHGNTHGFTKEPVSKISNGKRVEQVTIDNPGGRINVKSESFTGARAAEPFTSLHNIHAGIKEHRTEMKNKKREGQGIIYSSSGKINEENQKRIVTFATTKRPNVIHTVTKRPNVKTSIVELVEQGMINGKRQSKTGILPTGRSLLQYKIHDLTQKQSTPMADGQGKDQVKSASRVATSATVGPESHGEIHMVNTKSTARMVNNERAGEDLIHNPVSGSNDQGSKTESLDSNFHSTEHISNLVTPSTLHVKDQRNIKISPDNSGNIWKDGSMRQPSTKHSSVLSGINSESQTSEESLKTKSRATSLPHTISNHHLANTGITVEGMRDIISENTQNIIRYGKDVIVLPTRSSITRQPTDFSRHDIQNKRVDRPTNINQNNSAFLDTSDADKVDIAHGIRKEIAEFKSSVGTASSSQHTIIHKSRIIEHTIIANPSIEISNKRSSFINGNKSEMKFNHHDVNEKPSTMPELLSEKRQGNDVNVNDLISFRGSNKTLSVLKAEVNTKGKLGLDMKSREILNLMKLNPTVYLKENQTSQGKLTKSSQLGPKGTSLKQPLSLKKGTFRKQPLSLKTTQDHQPKLGNIQTTIKPRTPITKTKHDVECSEGFDLALIAIFPNSRKNYFSVVSQENSVRKTKVSSAPVPCDTLWPTLNSSPLVHDADSDGFLEIIYAVNYGTFEQNERTIHVKKFSIKVDSE